MGNIKTDWRCGLKEETVEALARITIEGPDLKEWAAVRASNAIEHWYKQKNPQNWAIEKKTLRKTSIQTFVFLQKFLSPSKLMTMMIMIKIANCIDYVS